MISAQDPDPRLFFLRRQVGPQRMQILAFFGTDRPRSSCLVTLAAAVVFSNACLWRSSAAVTAEAVAPPLGRALLFGLRGSQAHWCWEVVGHVDSGALKMSMVGREREAGPGLC
jgi:hypothetical protein